MGKYQIIIVAFTSINIALVVAVMFLVRHLANDRRKRQARVVELAKKMHDLSEENRVAGVLLQEKESLLNKYRTIVNKIF